MKYAVPAVLAVSLGLSLGLAACAEPIDESNDGSDLTELDTATTDGEEEALARAVDSGDFGELQLGAKIVGPQGPEPTGTLSTPEGNFADIRSYVACPAGMDPCDPANAPEGTVFTYVHVVHPGEDNDPSTGSGEGNDSSDIEIANAFKMTQPAYGFTGVAGYSHAEALSAAGAKTRVVITCGEDDNLVWTINPGEGGDQWEQAEPLTFYWQSTLPPSGPQEAYAIQANRTTATGPGPFPAPNDEVMNACRVPANNG